MSSWICAKCSHAFSSREALCEDWRVKELSLICPSCKSYLKETPRNGTTAWVIAASAILVFGSIALTAKHPSLSRLPMLFAFMPILWGLYSQQRRKKQGHTLRHKQTEVIHPSV
jgi:hypothetical protein